MKLSSEQEILLKKLLSNVVVYKETYEEVYDHVLTALEEQTPVINVHKQAQQILNADFGGYTGIAKMEYQRRNFTETDFYLKYLLCLKKYIHNPLIIVTLSAVAVGYYLTGNVYSNNSLTPLIIGFVISILPWVFVLVTQQARLLKTDQFKSSVAMETLSEGKIITPCTLYTIAAFVCYMLRLFCWNQGFRIAERILDGFSAILFALVLLNLIVFFNVYYTRLKGSLK